MSAKCSSPRMVAVELIEDASAILAEAMRLDAHDSDVRPALRDAIEKARVALESSSLIESDEITKPGDVP